MPLVFATRCTPVVPGSGSIAALDYDAFACRVEPIVVRDCSYLACHGNANFPFRVYSIGKLRAEVVDSLATLAAPLTPAERRANYESAVAFTYGSVSPDDNLLLRKVLPEQEGGFAHKGGALFRGLRDPRALTLRAWLSGELTGCGSGTSRDATEEGTG
jgi:hypothetical protein